MGGAASVGAAVGEAAGGAAYPVVLNVYDLTPLNNYLHWCGLGIFHSAVEGERPRRFEARNGNVTEGGLIGPDRNGSGQVVPFYSVLTIGNDFVGIGAFAPLKGELPFGMVAYLRYQLD
uniref:Uncharacterized protein n=1 Tax=Arundo donax TaxID=35708 RepID=A0A0A9D5G3_ARUDO